MRATPTRRAIPRNSVTRADALRSAVGLEEKEKLYLDCLDAYYNEGGKQLLSEDDYQKLKLDLEFSTSRVTVRQSCRRLPHASRLALSPSLPPTRAALLEGRDQVHDRQQAVPDGEADPQRRRVRHAAQEIEGRGLGRRAPRRGDVQARHRDLQGAQRAALEHSASGPPTQLSPRASIASTQVDLRVDNAKMRLLYFPGVAGGLILGCELSFWTLHIDPLLSIVLSAVPAYFFGKWFTENIFAQKPLVTQARRAPRSADASPPAPPHPRPLVTQAPCPKCNALTTVYFGDFFSVKIDGVIAPKGPPEDVLEVKCATCSEKLTADRGAMILQTQGEGPKTSSTKFMPA